jgi:hypothetical protein
MSGLACTDLCREEARNIIAQSEEIVQTLGNNGAYEGHDLMAAQCILSLKRLGQIIERRHEALAFEAMSDAQAQPVQVRRHWRLMPRWYPGRKGLPTEARTL